jgi:flagellar hook-associated protein 3 FlgL
LLDSLYMLNEQLEKASQQVSTGKKLTNLHDSPADSSEMVQLRNQLSQIDQYRTNRDSSSFYLQVTESALNSLHNLVTSIFTRGSEAGNNFNNEDVLATLATEIRSLRDEILSLANTQVRGRYIFAGSLVTSEAFEISGDTATYLGDDNVNTVDISNGLQVEQNVPGSTVFDPVFSTVETLLTAIDGGDQAAIVSALDQFESTLGTLGRARTRLGVELAKLENSETDHQIQEVNIQKRQGRIEDANLAEAISQLSRIRSALEATLTAGSLIRRTNLFDYMG